MASNDPTRDRRPVHRPPARHRAAALPRAAGAPAGHAPARSTPCWPAGSWSLETLLCTTLWGPQPAAWLWIGSQVFHETDSIGLAILTAFAGMLVTILGTLAIAMRLDRAWKIVRRAGGHEQKDGMLERIFVISMAIAGIAFAIWFLVIQGPGSDIAPR